MESENGMQAESLVSDAEGWTEIVCLLDRSGSMTQRVAETIDGFNTFVTEQQAAVGRARLTLVLFDRHAEVVWRNVDLRNAPELDENTYVVGRGTSLLDALGSYLKKTKRRLSAQHESERPTRVIFVVVTDGEDSTSRKYTHEMVSWQVQKARKRGWEVLFLGTDIDEFYHFRLGVGRGSSLSADNMRDGFSSMSQIVRARRLRD